MVALSTQPRSHHKYDKIIHQRPEADGSSLAAAS